ncbi:hypothetical protein BD770DRAFT_468587 [Pilaira anomala]|nr:hypothetical protein BD770DRAFT_468587 [Pilaira anomala]
MNAKSHKKRSEKLIWKTYIPQLLIDVQHTAAIDTLLNDQFNAGRLYAVIASRPGQSGRCDGYILEGKELEFYLRKIKSKKH